MKSKGPRFIETGTPPSRHDGCTHENRSHILEAFLSNRTSLRRFISKFLLPACEIDDIAQEAFLRAYQAERKKCIDEPKAFLFRIAKNLVLSGLRKKSTILTDYIEDFESSDILLGNDNLEENIIAQQKLGIYCEAVASLPDQCRRVFLLKKVNGMSHDEIAGSMEIAVSTVEKHLAKAIRLCNKAIDERYPHQSSAHRSTDGPDIGRKRAPIDGKKGN